MTVRGWCVFLALVVACKDKPRETASTSGSAASVVGSAAASDAAIATPLAEPVKPLGAAARCEDACLYLVDIALADAPAAFARDCGGKAWPYADDDCDALLFARNCIYAAYGNVFKRPEWKSRIEKLRWYKPRPDFKERDFSSVALANVKALVAASKVCGKPIPPVTAEDRERVRKWFSDLQSDRPLEIDGKPADTEALQNALRNLHVDDNTTTVYTKAPENGVRTIEVGKLFHAVGPGNTDESTTVQITFDANDRVIAVDY